MSTLYPGAIDSPSDPTANQGLNNPSHSAQHAFANDSVVALENKVGITGSAVSSSLDYQLRNAGSVDPGHLHTGASVSLTNSVTTAWLQNSSVTPPKLLIVDNAGRSINAGRAGLSGSYWRLQVGFAAISNSGGNGIATFAFPVPLSTTTGAFAMACVNGPASSLDFGFSISHVEIADVNGANARVNGANSGTVTFFIWGPCAS